MSDSLDSKALALLAQNGRMSWADLAAKLGMSAPSAADRVRKLEERGSIRGYAAIIDPGATGYELTAFVSVTLADSRKSPAFLKKVGRLPEILECHHVTGDDDYLLKVRCRGPADLERIIRRELKGKSGVSRTRTAVALSTAKEQVNVALPAD